MAKVRPDDDKADKADGTGVEVDTSAAEEINRVREGIDAAGNPAETPDAKQRLAKHLVAAGLDPGDLPEGVSVDPITDKDRDEFVKAGQARAAAARKADDKADDKAEASAADDDSDGGTGDPKPPAETARTQPPTGRSGRPTRTT